MHLEELTKKVYRVLKLCDDDHAFPSRQGFAVTEKILRECAKHLQLLQKKLRPLTVQGSSGPAVAARLIFVCSQHFIKRQESILDSYISMITLDFLLLQQLLPDKESPARIHQAPKPDFRMSQEVQKQALVLSNSAAQEQVSLLKGDPIPDSALTITDDLEPEDNAPPQTFLDDTDTQDANALHLSYSKVCRNCNERSAVISEGVLAAAVKLGQEDDVGRMIAADPESVCAEDAQRCTVLHHAARIMNPGIVKEILRIPQGQGLVDKVNNEGRTALMVAAIRAQDERSLKIAEMLIEKKCNINIVDNASPERSALYFAIEGSVVDSRPDFVNLLSEKGAELASVRKNSRKNFKKYEVLVVRYERENGG